MAEAIRIKPTEAKKERRMKPARSEQLALLQSKNTQWHLIAPPGCTREDLLEPAFWAYASDRFKSRDTIEVHAVDRQWWCLIQIRSVAPAMPVVVRELDYDEAPEPALTMHQMLPANHRIRYDEDRGRYFGERLSSPGEQDDHDLTGPQFTWAECLACLLRHPTITDR
jgi:hypothetical protein